MFSNSQTWAEGQVSEWCGELIDTGHETVQALATRFGLPLDDLRAAEPAGAEDTYHFFGHYYRQSRAEADFLAGVAARVAADADAAGYPTTFDTSTPAGAELDGMSVAAWIDSRVPGGRRSRLGQLLDVAYAIEYGADTTDQSALNLVYLLGFQPNPDALEIFGESDERTHIRGGNQRLPVAIAQHLGNVQTGYGLLRVAKTAAGRTALTFARGASSVEVLADYAVLALPFAVLRGLDTRRGGFNALKDQAIQELGRAHNGKTQLQFSRRLWNQPGAWPGLSNGASYSDTGYQASWDVTRGQHGQQGILNFYTGGSVTDRLTATTPFGTVSDRKVASDAGCLLKQAEPVFPGLTGAWTGRAAQSLPHKSPFFNASYSYWRVGQYLSFSGYEGVTQGRVLFCGEHTSQSFQGFMEGGASEGLRAADEIVKSLR
jgi:monoamine oxidase